MNFYIILMNLISLICEPFVLISFILFLYSIHYIKFRQIIIFLFGFCVVMVIKNIIKRPRPYTLYGNDSYNWIKTDEYSFPSGHTFCAFMTYFILKHNNIISNKFILIPILVGFSRIALNVHYISDIVGGAMIAWINYKLLL